MQLLSLSTFQSAMTADLEPHGLSGEFSAIQLCKYETPSVLTQAAVLTQASQEAPDT